MADYLIALFFLLVYEAFSWPLRLALQPAPMSPDVRRMLSRVVGPLLICLVSWFFARFLIPLHFLTIWGWYAAAFALAILVCRWLGHKPDWRAVFSPISNPKARRREWTIEAISLFVFFVFLYYRRLAPEMTTAEINAGLAAEKFDNAMIFWSSFFARWSPPEDYWLAGHSQAYYYFGHFFWAWIGRASLLPGEWVITLAMSRLVLSVWEGCYLLIRSFGVRSLSAALGAFLVAWGGNPRAVERLYTDYNYVSGRSREPEADQKFILSSEYRERAFQDMDVFYGSYPWWDPSRALRAEDITEFLAWTAILGDFHAHHLSIPWMLAWFAVVLAGDRWFRLRRGHGLSPRKRKRAPSAEPDTAAQAEVLPPVARRGFMHRGALWVASFLSLGVACTISNLWVAPMVGLASLGILFWRDGWGKRGLFIRMALIPILAACMVGGIILSKGSLSTPLPAQNAPTDESKGFFQKVIEKIPIIRLPAEIRSTVPMLARHWGFHVGILAVGFVALAGGGMGRFVRRRPYLFSCAVSVFLMCLHLKWKVWTNEPSLLWIGFSALIFCFAWSKRPGYRPLVTAYVIGGCLLLGALELIVLDDAYGGSMERYNSYFKFSFPIWPLLGAAAWVCAQRLWYWTGFRPVSWGFRAAGLMLLPGIMVMSVVGFPARTVTAKSGEPFKRRPTLDAVSWIEELPVWQAEGKMLRWIRENIPPGTRIAETANPTRGAYAFQGRVASLAGRPIPMGWTHHEGQWRGFADQLVPQQLQRVTALYNSKTKDEVISAAKALGVEWVVLGKVEREVLGPQVSEQFYKAIIQAQVEWQGFPANKPEVFLFRLPTAEE